MKSNIDISVVFITVKDLFYFILFLPSGRCTIIKHAATDMEMMEFDVYLAQKKKKKTISLLHMLQLIVLVLMLVW